ncbi:MAG: hypothetical protein U1E76_05620 [Planctomycetota bacterium]
MNTRAFLRGLLRVGGFIVCTGSAYLVLVHKPLRALRDLHDDVSARQAQVSDLRGKAKELEEFDRVERARFEGFLTELHERIPPPGSVNRTYDAVNSAALKTDSELVSCQVEPSASKVLQEDGRKSKYEQEQTKIKVVCPYASVGPFLGLLTASQRLIRIEWLEVKRSDDRFPKVTAEVQAVGLSRDFDEAQARTTAAPAKAGSNQ